MTNANVTDWAIQAPTGQIWSCDTRETAEAEHRQAPHMAVVCRAPGGEWLPAPVETKHLWQQMLDAVNALSAAGIQINPRNGVSIGTGDFDTAGRPVPAGQHLGLLWDDELGAWTLASV